MFRLFQQSLKKGLSLLEIILAIAIMAFAIVPIMNFAPAIMGNKEGVEQMTESVFLATQKMEEVRGLVMTDFAADRNKDETAFAEDGYYSDYRYDVDDTTVDADGDGEDDYKEIKVRAWHNLDSPDKIVLHTLIARRIESSPIDPTSIVYNFALARGYSLTIQSAVDDIDVRKSHTVGALDETFTEDVVINCDWVDGGAILVGGYGSDWATPDGTTVTTISGSVTVENGVVEMEYFIIE